LIFSVERHTHVQRRAQAAVIFRAQNLDTAELQKMVVDELRIKKNIALALEPRRQMHKCYFAGVCRN
jgi:hypothetical protein